MAAAKKKKPANKSAKKPAANKLKAAKKTAKPAKQSAAKTKKQAVTKQAKPAAAKPKKAKPTSILPTAAEETRFWSLIEDAWSTQSKAVNAARSALAKRKPGEDDDGPEMEAALEAVEESLRAVFANEDLPKEELVAMDRVLERKLYDIDRQDIQEVTDGSDDGFLYARGFIVALGKAFYDAVLANPKIAICDAEWEGMCYLPAQIHQERFGDYPETGSGISRESASNFAGWGR